MGWNRLNVGQNKWRFVKMGKQVKIGWNTSKLFKEYQNWGFPAVLVCLRTHIKIKTSDVAEGTGCVEEEYDTAEEEGDVR